MTFVFLYVQIHTGLSNAHGSKRPPNYSTLLDNFLYLLVRRANELWAFGDCPPSLPNAFSPTFS